MLVAVYLDISAAACMRKYKCHIIFLVNFFISPWVFYNNKYISLNRIYELTLCQFIHMAVAIKPYIVFFLAKIVIQTASLPLFIVIFSTVLWDALGCTVFAFVSPYKEYCKYGGWGVAPVYGYCHSLGLPLLLSLLSCKCSSSHLNDILIKKIKNKKKIKKK